MSFMYRLTDSKHSNPKQKRHPQSQTQDIQMAATTSFLDVPSHHAQRFMRPHDDVDDFLSSDLELSFASNVSIHSPPASEALMLSPSAGESDYAPMDISPAPAKKPVFERGRPRAFTSGARLFGRDMSNGLPPPATQVAPASLTKSGSTQSKRIQRSALPSQWFEPTRTSEVKQANGFSAVRCLTF